MLTLLLTDGSEICSMYCTSGIRDPNVHLSVETTKPPESRVDAVGSVGGRHHDDVSSLFQTVHQCQELGDNPTLHLSMSLQTVRRHM